MVRTLLDLKRGLYKCFSWCDLCSGIKTHRLPNKVLQASVGLLRVEERKRKLSLPKHPACFPHFAFITCHGPSSLAHRTANFATNLNDLLHKHSWPPSSATTLATCILATPK
jgi:hypothetical protein